MLAKAAGVSLRSVQRILEAHRLAPHRVRTFKLSTDPKFAAKLKDIVGLYVDPPAHAVLSDAIEFHRTATRWLHRVNEPGDEPAAHALRNRLWYCIGGVQVQRRSRMMPR